MVESPAEPSLTRRAALRESLIVWGLSLFACALTGLVGRFVPLVAENQLGFIALAFLWIPIRALTRRGVDPETWGFTWNPWRTNALVLVGVTLVVLPPFAFGRALFETRVLGRTASWTSDRLVRFDPELEGRPLALAPGNIVHAFHEADRLVVVATGDGPVDVTLRLGSPDGVPLTELRPTSVVWRAGELVPLVGRHGWELEDGHVRLLRRGPGGVALDARGVHHVSIAGSGAELRLGRYAVPVDAPYESRRALWRWLLLLLTQVVLVALPEEWLYRGYLQRRLTEAFPPTRRVLGVPLGVGWLLATACFAAGHLVLDPRPSRLLTFFPGLLFGWMAARTGSIAASVGFHALCNVLAQMLDYVFYG